MPTAYPRVRHRTAAVDRPSVEQGSDAAWLPAVVDTGAPGLEREYSRGIEEGSAVEGEVVARQTHDTLEGFIPLGWYAEWGEHFYTDPHNLSQRDYDREVSVNGGRTWSVPDDSTPIYDALMREQRAEVVDTVHE